MGARIAVVAGGAVLLIVLAVVLMSILGSAGKSQTNNYVKIAQKQAEIIRISNLGTKQAKSTSAKALAVNTRLSMESSQVQTAKILEKRGIKDKALSKELAKAKDTKIDAELETAAKNNRIDDTFVKIMEKQLSEYQKLLNQSESGASKTEREVLKNAFTQVSTIQKKVEPGTTQASTPSDPVPDTTDYTADDNATDSSEDFLEEDIVDTGDDSGTEDIIE
jgi:hypothetical protein